MTSYHSNLSAKAVDRHLQEALRELKRAEKNAVLWFADIMNRALFRDLGYSSIHQYAELALGFKKAKTSQFIRLSRALEGLPALKQSLAENAITWTKAREVTKVATRKTEKAWIREAKKTSRRELEHKVRTARRLSKQVRGQTEEQAAMLASEPIDPELIKEIPIDVRLRMMPEQFAQFEAMIEKLRKLGVKGSTEELIITAMQSLLGEALSRRGRDTGEGANSGEANADEAVGASNPFTRVNGSKPNVRSPYQIVVNACPRCAVASIETSRGALEISQVTLKAALCDAKIRKKGDKNRSSIPPSIRMEVMMRDHYRCRAEACRRNRFLNVHHIVPREKGGTNEIDNLITLCWGCHHTLHELAERSGRTSRKTPELAGIT